MGRIKISIIIVLIKYGWRVRRKNWWFRYPFLPIPPKEWVLWRIETAWGIDSREFSLSKLPPLRVIIKDLFSFGHFLKYVGGIR
tara:strand:+ start:167 stop:418 length:252 start_codon:yes stop_codon:yes gene_type:complete